MRTEKLHGLDTIALLGHAQSKELILYYYVGVSTFHMDRSSSWTGTVVKSNDIHPLSECSNRGICDRLTGMCECFDNFEGLACERTICPNDCSMSGVCYTQRQLAEDVGRIYETPWDADKNVGCVCDLGFRGPDCRLVECPSGPGEK